MTKESVGGSSIRVLLVDDSPEDREFYRRFLQRDATNSYAIEECESLEEGKDVCLNNPPDCVILDYNLPDGEGVELLESLADGYGEVHIPVIVLTGQGSEEVAVRVMKKGAMDYLIKGEITADSLCGTIGKVVEKNQMIQTIRRQRQENEANLSILQATLESTDNGIFAVDQEGRVIKTNTRFMQMWNVTNESINASENKDTLSFILQQLVEPDEFLSKMKALQGKVDIESFDTLQLKDGRIIECLSRPMLIESEPKGRVWSFRDVTENKRMEKRIRASEERLRTIFETMTDGLVIVDIDGKMVDTNTAACRLSGYQKEELIGVDSLEFVGEEDKERLANDMMEAIARGAAAPESLIYKLKKKDGGTFDCEMSTSVLKDGLGNHIGFIAVERDVTDRLRMERQLKEQTAMLIQSEKKSTLGTLVNGVAHELNNPMTGIINYTQYCLRHTEESDRKHEVLRDIEKEARRCANIIWNLVTFARLEAEGEEHFHKANVRTLVDRVMLLLNHRMASENVTVSQYFDDGIPQAVVQETNLEQVLFNLFNNSLDAMKISRKKEVTIEGRVRDEFIELSISDTGTGIPGESLKRVFDPFFTTKAAGEGTGLGLSVSKSICEQHGGDLICESEVGVGTKFTIRLPKPGE